MVDMWLLCCFLFEILNNKYLKLQDIKVIKQKKLFNMCMSPQFIINSTVQHRSSNSLKEIKQNPEDLFTIEALLSSQENSKALAACYQILPCVFKTEKHLSKKMNKVLYNFCVPIPSMSISFFESLLCAGPWMRCRVSLLSLPNHEPKWPWISFYIVMSLQNCAMNHRNDFSYARLFPFLV